MRTMKTAFIAAALILCAVPAFSHVRGGGAEIEVLSESRGIIRPLPYRDYYSGQTKVIKRYLEARKGENYSIVVRNNSAGRIGVVVAVDGRNIITGRKSFLRNDEMMYIIGPYASAHLEGWRTDQETVHKFYFTDTRDSYTAKTFGDLSAMGLITVACFREKEPPPPLYEHDALRENAPSPSAAAPSPGRQDRAKTESAGTGFGDRTHSPVVKVDFEAEGIPFEKILVKYEWRETLCRKGLLKCHTEGKNRLWDEDRYAPFPPDYREQGN